MLAAIRCCRMCNKSGAREGTIPHTVILAQLLLALVVDCEPYSPGRQISHDYGTQASVHAAQTLISPNDLGGTKESIVHLGLAHMPPMVEMGHATLSLEFRLDDIERAGHYARGEATYCAG